MLTLNYCMERFLDFLKMCFLFLFPEFLHLLPISDAKLMAPKREMN